MGSISVSYGKASFFPHLNRTQNWENNDHKEKLVLLYTQTRIPRVQQIISVGPDDGYCNQVDIQQRWGKIADWMVYK